MTWWRSTITVLVALASLAISAASADEVLIRDAGGNATVLYRGSYALVIGAAHYEHNSWNELRRVPDEVGKVETALRAQGFDVETVLDPDGEDLRKAIHQFVVKHGSGAKNVDNRLLIFFSGHGHTRQDDRGYLVPVDAPDPYIDEEGFLDKALSMVDVMGWARKIEAKHALFVFDSCFSGTVFMTKALPRRGETYIRDRTAKPVRQFITAGDAGQEVPAESIFTPLFIRALEGEAEANANGDDYVTGAELGVYLTQKVPDYGTGQTPQYGKIRDPKLDLGDFVFEIPNKSELITWERIYKGAGMNDVFAMADGGFLAVGSNARDSLLLRVDRQGRELWRRTYQRVFRDYRRGLAAIEETSDGAHLLIGVNGRNGLLLKVDQQGRELWRRTYTDEAIEMTLTAIAATRDGSFLLAGRRRHLPKHDHYDGLLLKVDADGRELWRRVYEGEGLKLFLDGIAAAPNSGFVLSGRTGRDLPMTGEGLLLKIDDEGRELWRRTFEIGDRGFAAIAATPDGGFLLAGGRWASKVDADGRELWRRAQGCSYLVAISLMSDGSALFAGSTWGGWYPPLGEALSSIGAIGTNTGCLLKVDHEGVELWRRTYGSAVSDGFRAIVPARDGGFFLVGYADTRDDNEVDALALWDWALKGDGSLKRDDRTLKRDGWALKVDREGRVRPSLTTER